MKKLSILAAVLVLTLTVFTGCRRKNAGTVPSTAETMMPTVATTEAATTPTTEMTVPTTTATQPTNGNGRIPDGTDPDNNTNGTEAGMEGRSRNSTGSMGR